MEAAIISTGSFPPIDRAQWLEALRGEAFARSGEAPVSPSYADLHFEQLRQEPARAGQFPLSGGGWTIVQRVDDVNAKRANAQAQFDIEAGATGLAIVFEGAPNAFGYGLPARPEALAAALHNIPLNRIYLRIDVHPSSRVTIDWIIELMRRKRVDPSRLSLSFGIDPAAVFAGNGSLRMSLEALRASMPQSLAHFFAMGIPATLLEADGRVLHNAGATEAQELGAMMAGAVSHLRMFQEARQPLIYATPHIGFALSVTQDQFLSIAKLRALRLLWAKAQEACGLQPIAAKIHAETSYRMLTLRAPENNILRSSMAAFAAAAGGADTISVLPPNIPHGLPDRRGRQIARNAQLVLSEETHLSSLASPAFGSEELNILTASLCAAAWDEFRQIEAEGGLLNSLGKGMVQQRVTAARQQALAQMQGGKVRIVGTSGQLHLRPDVEKVSTLKAERREVPQDGVVFCDSLPPLRLDEMLDDANIADADAPAADG
ncbi:methylmalonyl-CoA mutase family protein [Aerobium aerolatum]|uniref:Heterodimeric methylmalonyl-CoA mutase small subunit n=1 Tax=Aquamicrobium aerolatum DSM 21857 TaxID=1121003 RepID=A0A1I3JIW2_9HYPH|nr:methylmalonyl-CoA mutase family protein [Aquamicrobium aerolatum]SFI59928.1 heterodimeric methylmalonyl-CoA mutase small subunit [Aquamicrobium aerolatum DSM 21857]